MGSSPSSVVTLTTRHRPWWAWWLIRWARWLHGMSGALVVRVEQ